jgi:hypothetical protein
MEQRSFNNKLEKLVSDIEKKYYYDHKDLLNKVYDEVYKQLDYNFQEFDQADFAYTELGQSALKIKCQLYTEENELIQSIDFII